jgi:hypothetical protein
MKSIDPFLLPRLGLALLDKLSLLDAPASGAAGRIVLVSSALRSEGKSFVAGALSRALVGQCAGDLVLVDASVPTFGPTIGAASGAAGGGLGALLATGEWPAEGLHATDVPGLWRLSRGGLAPNQSLFQPSGVRRTLDRLRQRFALSVIDGGILTECGALVHEADLSLIVTDASRTASHTVRSAMTQARLAPQQVAGVVLNRRAPGLPRWLGGD